MKLKINPELLDINDVENRLNTLIEEYKKNALPSETEFKEIRPYYLFDPDILKPEYPFPYMCESEHRDKDKHKELVAAVTKAKFLHIAVYVDCTRGMSYAEANVDFNSMVFDFEWYEKGRSLFEKDLAHFKQYVVPMFNVLAGHVLQYSKN